MARYTRGDRKYVSVTQLLDIFYPFNEESFKKWCESSGNDSEKIKEDSERMGNKVSEWIENAKLGISWIDSPCTSYREEGLYRAVQSFLGANKVVSCEQVVYCDEYGYAGTYDMEAILSDCILGLYDSKTYNAWNGQTADAWIRMVKKIDPSKIKKVTIQVSMYAYAKYGEKASTMPLGLIVFRPDGTYEVIPLKYTDKWKELIKKNEDKIKLLLDK